MPHEINPSSFFYLLNANNYQTYNRDLAKRIGLEAAIFLSELVDKFCYFEKNGAFIEGEWFYLTVEDVLDRTALRKDSQQTAVKKLIALGLIETKLIGCPARRHFKLIQKNFTILLHPANQLEESRQLGGGTPPTPPYIKEPKEEPKEEYPSISPLPGQVLKFGEFVKLTQKQYDELVKVHGSSLITEMIDCVNDHVAAHGKKYKDFAATIRNFIRNQKKREPQWKKTTNSQSPYSNSKPTSSAKDSPELVLQEPGSILKMLEK